MHVPVPGTMMGTRIEEEDALEVEVEVDGAAEVKEGQKEDDDEAVATPPPPPLPTQPPPPVSCVSSSSACGSRKEGDSMSLSKVPT